MIEFRKPVLDDGETIRQIVKESGRMGCEYSFGNIFSWSVPFNVSIAICCGFFVSYSEADKRYCFPAGSGDLKKIIGELKKDASQRGAPLALYGVTKEDAERLSEIYSDEVVISPSRNSFDYIYWTNDLYLLPGKKYRSKRNHITAFEKSNKWETEEINDGNIEECVNMSVKWAEKNFDKNPVELAMEQTALATAFKNYGALGFFGAILRNESGIVAFTFGEEINHRIFCTHFEKAYADVRGAYPMINREFAGMLRKYKYINREEDAGDEGLRRAKMSYRPAILLEKNVAEFRL